MTNKKNKFKVSDLDTPYTQKGEEPFISKMTNKMFFVVTHSQKQFRYFGRIVNELGEAQMKKRVLGVYETKVPSKRYSYLTVQEARKKAIDFEGGIIAPEIITPKDSEFLKGEEWIRKNFWRITKNLS